MITDRYIKINAVIFILLIILPSIVLASIPTPIAFDRDNTYELDGYRPGGYYVIRQNPALNGSMNISYSGGDGNTFNITTDNIENITLDFDLMYGERSFLFGWGNITWEDAVASLNNRIHININNTDGLSELRFVDQPDLIVRISLNDIVIHDWDRLEDIIIYTNNTTGDNQVLIEFQPFQTLVGNLMSLLQFIVFFGIMFLVLRWIHRALFYDEGEYYNSFGGE